VLERDRHGSQKISRFLRLTTISKDYIDCKNRLMSLWQEKEGGEPRARS
jgi:hypothetical protein